VIHGANDNRHSVDAKSNDDDNDVDGETVYVIEFEGKEDSAEKERNTEGNGKNESCLLVHKSDSIAIASHIILVSPLNHRGSSVAIRNHVRLEYNISVHISMLNESKDMLIYILFFYSVFCINIMCAKVKSH